MKNCLAFLFGLFLSLPLAMGAEIIYDNTDNFLLKINSTDLESGDQVRFVEEGRVLDYFAFEYFATPSVVTHGASARVRFYLNDGPVGTNAFAPPGTLIYDSGSFLLVTNTSTVEISSLRLYVPTDTLTWTVQFSGILPSERAGVLFYDPPLVGSSDDFLWQRENEEWRAVQASTSVVNNLSARFRALQAVRVKSVKIEDSAVVLTVSTTPGKVYSLEFKGTLQSEIQWVSVEHSALRASGDEVKLTDPSGAGQPFRVYRVAERDGTTPVE